MPPLRAELEPTAAIPTIGFTRDFHKEAETPGFRTLNDFNEDRKSHGAGSVTRTREIFATTRAFWHLRNRWTGKAPACKALYEEQSQSYPQSSWR
jgi:hypothetical protein